MTSSGTIKPVIYRIDNLIDGKFYIGVAGGGVLKRRREHFSAARLKVDKGRSKLYNAIRKYGEDQFQFSIMEELDTYADALAREVLLIAELAPHYNITKGGQGVTGHKMPRDIVERLAAQQRGSIGYWRGKTRPPETIEKIRRTKLDNPPRS